LNARSLIQNLIDIQDAGGCVPDAKVGPLIEGTAISLAQVEGLRSFFPHLHRDVAAKVEIEICRDMTCHLRGAGGLIVALAEEAKKVAEAAERAGCQSQVSVRGVSCLGRCDRAPAARINHKLFTHGSLEELRNVVIAPERSKALVPDTDANNPGIVCDLRLKSSVKDISDIPKGDKGVIAVDAVDHVLHFRMVDANGKIFVDTDQTKLKEKAQQIEELRERLAGLWSPHELTMTERRSVIGAVTSIVGAANSIDPSQWQIDIYDGPSDFRAVKQVAAKGDASWVLGELRTAGLRGMGGAGVEAHKKWHDVCQAAGDVKYVVCNADESEPATFKDREILLRKAHLVVEGIAIAALVVGAKQGYVYLRDEYPEQALAVEAAIVAFNASRAAPTVRIETFRSPGGYICGEQTALIEAMESRRAEPRNRPPQLETNGLWDKPTVLNNVETLAWVPAIVARGGAWYRQQGRNGANGLRFFSISGDVARPGVYEVPIGLTLREFLNDFAGGMRDGVPLSAVAPSGPSGGFLPPRIPLALPKKHGSAAASFLHRRLAPGASDLDVLDLELDLNLWRELGLMLGAGMVVYGGVSEMASHVLNSLEFFQNETCGKCVPCRIGTQKLVGLGAELLGPRIVPSQFAQQQRLVTQLARTMEQTSICGLGTVAPAPLTSFLKYFQTPGAIRTRAALVPLPIVEHGPTSSEEESLFARELNDQLIRFDDPSVKQYENPVTLVIDGLSITRPEALPLTDHLGDVLFDSNGATSPRATTIYDAAEKLFESEPNRSNPVPILCHQPHLRPVAVCRVCVVLIGESAFDVRLQPSVKDASNIRSEGTNLIVLARVDEVLHFRIFDGDGTMVVDIDEKGLPEYAQAIEDLRKRLESLWPPHELVRGEKARVIAAVKSIVGHIREKQRVSGKLDIKWQRKLLPACQHPISEGMLVLTQEWNDRKESDLREWLRGELANSASEDRIQVELDVLRKQVEMIRGSVTTLAELLFADHIREDRPFDNSLYNELRALGTRLALRGDLFTRREQMPQPGRAREEQSRSKMLAIDHDACILCDRCIRGCSDVRHNNIMGRTGKGAQTLIGFDLNVPMRDSDCVECGECLVSCPTSAITALRVGDSPDGTKARGAWSRLVHDFLAIVPTKLQSVVKEIRLWLSIRKS
jgi:formate dehydrogenase beta subunit